MGAGAMGRAPDGGLWIRAPGMGMPAAGRFDVGRGAGAGRAGCAGIPPTGGCGYCCDRINCSAIMRVIVIASAG